MNRRLNHCTKVAKSAKWVEMSAGVLLFSSPVLIRLQHNGKEPDEAAYEPAVLKFSSHGRAQRTCVEIIHEIIREHDKQPAENTGCVRSILIFWIRIKHNERSYLYRYIKRRWVFAKLRAIKQFWQNPSCYEIVFPLIPSGETCGFWRLSATNVNICTKI